VFPEYFNRVNRRSVDGQVGVDNQVASSLYGSDDKQGQLAFPALRHADSNLECPVLSKPNLPGPGVGAEEAEDRITSASFVERTLEPSMNRCKHMDANLLPRTNSADERILEASSELAATCKPSSSELQQTRQRKVKAGRRMEMAWVDAVMYAVTGNKMR
jgi:hypothetical protein